MPVIRQVRDQVYGLGASYHPDWDATRLILFFYIGWSFALFFCTSDEFFFEIGRVFHVDIGRRFSFVLKWSLILFWVIKRHFFFVLISDEDFYLILDEVFFWCRTKFLFDRTKFDIGRSFCLISDEVNFIFWYRTKFWFDIARRFSFFSRSDEGLFF